VRKGKGRKEKIVRLSSDRGYPKKESFSLEKKKKYDRGRESLEKGKRDRGQASKELLRKIPEGSRRYCAGSPA